MYGSGDPQGILSAKITPEGGKPEVGLRIQGEPARNRGAVSLGIASCQPIQQVPQVPARFHVIVARAAVPAEPAVFGNVAALCRLCGDCFVGHPE
jgi:hypothetical protein